MWILLFLQTAYADMTVCFDDNQGEPIVDARVSHTEFGAVNGYVTDDDGCVRVVTWFSKTWVNLHAENRVVKVVSAGLPSQNALWSRHGQTHVLSSNDYRMMTDLQRVYDAGLAGVGPFPESEPTGTYGHWKITADLNSVLTPGQAWVEPVVAQESYPRLHLNPSMFGGSVLHHEMMHALHFSRLAPWTRAAIEAEMAAYLASGGRGSFTRETTPGVAWIEGIAELGSAVYKQGEDGCWQESCWSTYVTERTEDLPTTGSDAVAGVVAGVLYAEFAEDVGFDYVLHTLVDCESRTLQQYATCIHDKEGRTSQRFGQLRQAARVYGVTFDVMPPGHWDYCNTHYTCNTGEGDCDTTAHCAGIGHCSQDVGEDYGLAWDVDVCEAYTMQWMQL